MLNSELNSITEFILLSRWVRLQRISLQYDKRQLNGLYILHSEIL